MFKISKSKGSERCPLLGEGRAAENNYEILFNVLTYKVIVDWFLPWSVKNYLIFNRNYLFDRMRWIRNYGGTYNVILSLCIIHILNEKRKNITLIDILRWFLSIFPTACIVYRNTSNSWHLVGGCMAPTTGLWWSLSSSN